MPHQPQHPIRIVTATSLFDGHDASINIIRRMLQERGAEVIHLGHNRSVEEVVTSALQESVQGIAISSYQGGHMEYFKYMKDSLDQAGAGYVKIYGGGGGVIVPEEKRKLEEYGIAKIFHPDDGRRLGLEGMIKMIIEGCDFDIVNIAKKHTGDWHGPIPSRDLGLAISTIELRQEKTSNHSLKSFLSPQQSQDQKPQVPQVLGITGTGGSGKSSLIDELLQRFLNIYPNIKIGVICVDPSKKKTGGALLGDRIRMNSLSREGTFMRSLASRGSGNEISQHLSETLNYCKGTGFDLLIAESSGIGQASTAITEIADFSLYVMTSEFGSQSQLEKIDMIDYADFISINKADHRGAQDAHRDVIKQYRRSRKIFDTDISVPIFLTQASNFNDKGVNELFLSLTEKLKNLEGEKWTASDDHLETMRGAEKQIIVPPERQHYLAEITSTIRNYKEQTKDLTQKASLLSSLEKVEKRQHSLKSKFI